MRVGKIVSLLERSLNLKTFNSKKDIVSFGVQEKQNFVQNELISKTTTDALKNKYGANISFDGHHKTVNVTELGENVVTSRKYLYGSNGCVWSKSDTYQGHTYGGGGFLGEEKTEQWERDQYVAKMDGSNKLGADKHSGEGALLDAIIKSEYFVEGSTIQKIREPYEWNHHSTSDVYFADEYETVDRSIVDDISVKYIVLAPKAKLANPLPQRKSLLERIFG